MKIVSLGVAAATLLTASPVLAQSYTGTYTNDASSVVLTTFPESPGSPEQGAATFKGVSKTTDATDKADVSPYTCVDWLTPGQPTATSGVCKGANSAGDTWVAFIVCARASGAPDPTKPGACWGDLRGTGGTLKGKTGQFTQFGTNASGVSQGAWN